MQHFDALPGLTIQARFLRRPFDIEAPARVRDFERQGVVVFGQRDERGAGARMSGDVTQGFERHAVEADGHVEGKLFAPHTGAQPHVDLFLVPELAGLRFEGGDQPQMFEHVRVELVRQPPELRRQFFGLLDEEVEFGGGLFP